ncbi:flagellar rod protein [Diplonema papillatum]|nr:paraflagellar rod protein 5 [Diplonema papillatum]KAJ9473684.1 flagellar rod protein [Diplonema papillatum]
MAIMSATEGILKEEGPTFEKLKENLFFTEKRLALLLDAQVYPEMMQWIKEKADARRACKTECHDCVAQLEASVAGKMRGVWNEVRVVQVLGVEVELRSLVGCPWYDKPSVKAIKEVADLMARIRQLSTQVPHDAAAAAGPSEERTTELQSMYLSIDWCTQDVSRLAESLRAKEKLLLGVSELTKALREIGWSCSLHEAKREEHRRKAKAAEDAGEVDMYQTYAQREIDEIEALLQLLLFKLQTTESSEAENILKRRNNVSQWKLAAARLETLKEKKLERRMECVRDKGRAERGLKYEAAKHAELREDFKRRKKLSDDVMESLDKAQDTLTAELESMAQRVKTIEEQLTGLAKKREGAVTASVEIVEAEAQRVADYQEFVRYVTQHAACLENTQKMAEDSASLLSSLQLFLMDEQEYDEHDFHQTTHLLKDTKKNTVKQLSTCYANYAKRVSKLLSQVDAKIRIVEAEAANHQMKAECHKETLNPEAKRFVNAVRDKLREREALQEERAALVRKLEFVRVNFYKKVEDELLPHEKREAEEAEAALEVSRREKLAGLREALCVSSDNILEEEQRNLLLFSELSNAEKETGATRVVGKGKAPELYGSAPCNPAAAVAHKAGEPATSKLRARLASFRDPPAAAEPGGRSADSLPPAGTEQPQLARAPNTRSSPAASATGEEPPSGHEPLTVVSVARTIRPAD